MVRQVCQGSLLGHPHNPSCYRLATAVVAYAIMLLLEGGLGDGCILKHCFVVTEHICRALNGNPKHAQLIA